MDINHFHNMINNAFPGAFAPQPPLPPQPQPLPQPQPEFSLFGS